MLFNNPKSELRSFIYNTIYFLLDTDVFILLYCLKHSLHSWDPTLTNLEWILYIDNVNPITFSLSEKTQHVQILDGQFLPFSHKDSLYSHYKLVSLAAFFLW